MLSFDNTKDAFAYKTDKELSRANFVFSLMKKLWLIDIGIKILPSLIQWRIPFIKRIVCSTIFKQFVGGETLPQTAPIVNKLNEYNVQVILDYGVENGKKGEAGFDRIAEKCIEIIEYTATQANIPFISIKITSLARYSLLEKINNSINASTFILITEILSVKEKEEWEMVVNRINKICLCAEKNTVKLLIDAEESWIQNSIDYLAALMMTIVNREKAIVYNTVQLYRVNRLQFLRTNMQTAADKHFILGVKIVRGAYMEKERTRALQMNYPSPIQPDKEACDKAYNEAIAFCMKNLNTASLIIASHNEHSCLYATELLQQQNISNTAIHFSQLYGMGDHITFNLAKAGYSVSKYLPFGPIKEVVPYLMRRARENSSVNKQSGKTLCLIQKEIKRRKDIK